MIYIESYTHVIAFQWLVKKQEWRESSNTNPNLQRSVVKDKMTEAFENKNLLNIKPIPIMLGSEKDRIQLASAK